MTDEITVFTINVSDDLSKYQLPTVPQLRGTNKPASADSLVVRDDATQAASREA